MPNIIQIIHFDDLASMDSPIHNLEGRIKLISTVFIIIVCVISKELIVPIIFEIFLLIILKIAKFSYIDSFKRLLLLLPFGGFIIIFQPFIHAAENFIVIVDESKVKKSLGDFPVPVEVLPDASRMVIQTLEDMGAICNIRMAIRNAFFGHS